MDDSDIDNCGIWPAYRDVFVKVCATDDDTTAEPSADTSEDPCLADIDEFDSLGGECTPNEFTLDCGEDKIYCVVHEECVKPLIDEIAKEGLTCEQIESTGEPVDTTSIFECEDVALVTGPDGALSDRTCAQAVEGRGRNQCAGRLGE
eukprot:UN04651